MEGRVHLDVLVGRDGMPLDIVRGRIEPEALHVALADRLADSAIAAVRAWTFEPAMRDGAPYEARVIVPIAFGAGVAADVAAAADGDVTALDTIVVREP
ncbi:energy transducer TonB [Dokdonella sp. MW10]|uniref:energy transducer TonB n=1 Tax=Dokdonella sp. MW10 TaxID=2992926 RepID=UPI003F7FCC1C